jgi:ATP-dependent RNA helicase RhlB
MDFTEFNLHESLMKGIENAGYKTCTPVQEQVLKAGLTGDDLYVQSQTGTGKTASYLTLMLQQLLTVPELNGKKALIMVPTRELAVQVEEEAETLAQFTGLKTGSFYGGVGYEKQTSLLKENVDILVGKPGRVIDLQESGTMDLSQVAFLVVDEADRMFDMGFYDDLRKILKCLPEAETRQTMLFSATLNTYVKNLAWEYTRDPIEITIEAENITVSEITQELLHVSSDEKMKLLVGILKHENPESAIIFCNTKRSCEVIAKRLVINEIKAEFMIGDLPQSKRLAILNKFKAGEIKILVATDVAARGIDVDDLAMVINYDLPVEAENYVHRIGRTARAGKSGKAYTFCSEQDVYNLPAIERYIEMQIPATVAYPEQMEEDKSAGIFIKTENWRGDDELDNRHGYRKGRDGDIHNRGRDNKSRNGKYSGKPDYKKKSDGYKKDGYNKGDYKKNGHNDYKKNNRKPYIDPEKLAGLSYEERMKLYKDAYKNSSYKKDNYNKKGNYQKNDYKKNNYKGGQKKYDNSNRKPAPQEKKTFWQKVKAFFGR